MTLTQFRGATVSLPSPNEGLELVDLDESVGGGGYVFAFDAADLAENIENEIAVGGYINCDPEDTVESIRRIKAVAQQRGYPVIPGHDPVVWPKLTEEFQTRWDD